jgi:murein DD-endopeptidase MepM/ murein hydrolase activator NlpD
MTALVLSLLASGWLAAPAAADELDTRKAQLGVAMAEARVELEASSAVYNAASQRVSQAQAQVAQAQADLLQAEADVLEATQQHDLRQLELDQSQAELEQARQHEEAGLAALESERSRLGQVVRSTFQQNSPLVALAAAINPDTTASVSNRLQWVETVFATGQAGLDRLKDLQLALAQARGVRAVAEARADLAEQAAADYLDQTEAAEQRAQQAKAALDSALAVEQAAKTEAQDALAADQRALADLEREQNAVNAAIAQRAEEARRQQEAAASGGGSSAAGPSSYGLIRPVDGRITSAYGMRVHPITGVYKLHDGTDLGSGCGTPIKAAASGTVTDRYYNSAYGNRVFIDHGIVSGRHMVTSYNHLSSFAVAKGAWVSQGQIIGYVGTTGMSTGCHLHLMLWVNGSLTNVMNYL